MSKLEELLNELEGQEKTAEEVFASNISEESSKEESTEETVEEKTAEKADDSTSEEVSEETEVETSEESEGSEEKTASSKEEDETSTDSQEQAVKTASSNEEELVKVAKEMGQIAARTFYSELVAMGIMPPTNKDMPVPPVSSVSMPQQSPVTIKADAKAQMQAGHDAYDLQHNYAPTNTGKAEKGQNEGMIKKKASLINKEFLTNFYNKLNSEEN